MSLVSLLEGCKDVALAKREELAAQAAQDVAEFEEYGTDMVRGPPRSPLNTRFGAALAHARALFRSQALAYDEEAIAAEEEALRLGQELDERQDDEVSEREKADLEVAKAMLAADESTDDVRRAPHARMS